MCMTKKQVVIFSPFRVGASTIEKTLNEISNVRAKKIYTYTDKEAESIPPQTIDTIVLIYRDPIDRYISAFFADCTKKEYPYYFGSCEKVLATPINELIKHFNKFRWTEFGWLSYDYYIHVLDATFSINIVDIQLFINSQSKQQILLGQYEQKPIKCLLLKTQYLDQSVGIINQVFNSNIKSMPKCHSHQNQWYSKKYIEFIKQFYQELASEFPL